MVEIEISKTDGLIDFDDIDAGDVSLLAVWHEYVDHCRVIPKFEGRNYLLRFEEAVPAKLIRQCMYAGMAYALQHPDKVRMV